MTDQPRQPGGDFDMTQFPGIFNAVMDIMPNRDMWLARFAEQPGGTTTDRDADGWLTVCHRGDVVMKLHLDTFKPGAPLGQAQVMVDGQWQEVGVEWDAGEGGA